MSFKQKEIPVYNTMEEWLMDDLKIPTRSDVYKASLKNLYHQRNCLLYTSDAADE